MTTLPANGSNLAQAVLVLTAWRDRAHLGDETIVELLNAAAVDAGGWGHLTVALADLANGLLRGAEKSAANMLTNPSMLSKAIVAAAREHPMTPDEVGMDAPSILDRVGRVVAGFPT